MPSNRPDVEREQKIAEILAAADRRLREGGYEALSVAAIARELNLAPNTIYWYFASKDDLFVAAVRHMLEGIVARKPPSKRSLEHRVLWFVEQLDELEHLRVALYERGRRSETVAGFVAELDSSSRQLVTGALRGEVPDDELETAAKALLATIEGATLQRLPPADRRRVVSYTLRRITAE